MAASAVAPSRVTTWVLVTTYPSLERMTPDPVPLPAPPAASMVTTLGTTFAAIAVVWLTSSVSLTVTLVGPVAVVAVEVGWNSDTPA